VFSNYNDGPYFVVIDDIVYPISDRSSVTLLRDLSTKLIRKTIPAGALTSYKQQQQLLVQNGDQDNDFAPDWCPYNRSAPTVSFECIRRFYTDKATTHDIARWLASGTIRLVDHMLDEMKYLTKKQLKAWKVSGKCPVAPLGYTLIVSGYDCESSYFHRSGTALFHDTETDQYFLLGQDEGTYFGVELPRKVTSVEKAFELLTPKKVRGAKDVQRQGEWFAVPVKEKDVPPITEAIALIDRVSLPVDHPDANLHSLECISGRISRDGQIYAKDPVLSHEEHRELDLTGWYTFYHNTAVRSVSVEGVD
jgi:hypothetical protein